MFWSFRFLAFSCWWVEGFVVFISVIMVLHTTVWSMLLFFWAASILRYSKIRPLHIGRWLCSHLHVDEVQKNSNTECNAPSLEPFWIIFIWFFSKMEMNYIGLLYLICCFECDWLQFNCIIFASVN
jgi:hypothetical protein